MASQFEKSKTSFQQIRKAAELEEADGEEDRLGSLAARLAEMGRALQEMRSRALQEASNLPEATVSSLPSSDAVRGMSAPVELSSPLLSALLEPSVPSSEGDEEKLYEEAVADLAEAPYYTRRKRGIVEDEELAAGGRLGGESIEAAPGDRLTKVANPCDGFQDFPAAVQTEVVNRCASLWRGRRALGRRCRRLIDVNANAMAFELKQSAAGDMVDNFLLRP